ncbi:MAG: hypothetical protein ABIK43_03500, partial [candidate division WOR-3 bacterium]
MIQTTRVELVPARELARALHRGMIVAPVLDGCCVLGLNPDELTSAVGNAHRLILDRQVLHELLGQYPDCEALVRLLDSRAVVVFHSDHGGGIGLGTERYLIRLKWLLGQELWIGIPDEPTDPVELAEMLGGRAILFACKTSVGRGPTVVNVSKKPPVIDRRGVLSILEVEERLGGPVRLRDGIIFSVLIVCTGNSCRSPLAAAVLGQMLEGMPVLVGSAGTSASEGAPISDSAVRTAARMGLDISSVRARQVTAEICQGSDLIL